jgi:dipeptidyl aminopeptidase/acylaminoacyl peptidase
LFENENENENELIIQINDETESFIHSNEEDDDENGAGYVMQPPSNESKHANRVAYITGGCIIAFMIFIIFIFLTSTKSGGTIFTPGRRITLKEIYSGTLRPQKNPVFWFDHGDDGTVIHMGTEGNIELYNVISKETKVVALLQDLNKEKESKLNLGFLASSDLRYILITTSVKTVFRHSKLKNYVIFDTKEKSYLKLKDELNNISNIEFSPSGNKLAFVKNNNLYFMNLENKQTTQITHDGSENIFNGISDWVYEEEVLMKSQAFYWSPDSKYLGFIKFDDTEVPEFEIPVYLDNNFEGVPYPDKKSIKYPKPGYPNPDVNVYIYDTTNNDPKNNLKKVVYEKDYEFKQDNLTILQVLWATETSENFMIRTSNRVQDTARLFSVNIPKELKNEDTDHKKDGTIEATFLKEDEFDDDGWLTRTESIYFVPPKSYIEIMEDHNGYQHINFYNDIYEDKSQFITSGEWEVNSIEGIDKDKKIIYYIGSEEGSMQRHLYKVNFDGQRNIKMTPIVSEIEEQKENIDLFGDNLTEVGVYSASFSPGFNYYLLNYEGPGVPWQKILSTSESYDKFNIDVADNKRLEELLTYYETPKFRRFEIPIKDYTVNALAIYPPDFKESSRNKYPVLFHPYGGPNSQMADYSYQMDFNAVLASDPNHPLIVVIVDGRGTAWKGRKFRVGISKQLGKLEAEDQIEAAKYMQKLSYVDSDKIAIWGWSYGGYLTSKVIEANSGVFKVGMAVAPVTDWRLYDTLYTERYMKTLEDNKKGYIDSAVRNVTGFNNVDFLLVHGTEDDNVHFQNSAILSSKLTLNGVKYTSQYYTDNAHSMGFGNAYSQLMDLLTNFLYKHLFDEK